MSSILIVGGGSGIGLACAELALENHWLVVIAGRSEERLLAAKEKLGDVRTISFDAYNLNKARAALGDLDVEAVVATSGSDAGAVPSAAMSASGIVQAIETKAGSQLMVLQAAKDTLSSLSSMTFVTGALARKPAPGMAPLIAANAVLETLTPVLAKELAPVRVNSVSPGFVETPIYASLGEKERAEMTEAMKQASPLGRNATPRDVAGAVWFSVTNQSVNGAVLPLDTGI
ncbi:SDR family oxidoreductase [Pelagibius sp.]|uniref:SDR family oxidoreductase n=1 Tax=Pelagibius sp. TaxID=1931238 RepID=UPI003B50376D